MIAQRGDLRPAIDNRVQQRFDVTHGIGHDQPLAARRVTQRKHQRQFTAVGYTADMRRLNRECIQQRGEIVGVPPPPRV